MCHLQWERPSVQRSEHCQNSLKRYVSGFAGLLSSEHRAGRRLLQQLAQALHAALKQVGGLQVAVVVHEQVHHDLPLGTQGLQGAKDCCQLCCIWPAAVHGIYTHTHVHVNRFCMRSASIHDQDCMHALSNHVVTIASCVSHFEDSWASCFLVSKALDDASMWYHADRSKKD